MRASLLNVKFVYILVVCLGHSIARSINSYNGSQMLRIMLTVDVSNSMEGDKLTETADALKKWILEDLWDGIELGIVQFSSSARVLSKPTPLNDAKRQELISIIPTDAQGEGLVDRGLEKAIEELQSKESELVILLITDIEISEKITNIHEIKSKVRESDIKVFTIAIGNEAKISDFEELANGGLTFHLTDENSTSSSIFQALEEIVRTLEKSVVLTTVNIMPSTSTNVDVISQEASTVAATANIPFIDSNDDKITEFVSPFSNPEVITSGVEMNECKSDENCNNMSFLVVGVIVGSVIVLLVVLIIAVIVYLLKRKKKLVPVRGSYQLIHK